MKYTEPLSSHQYLITHRIDQDQEGMRLDHFLKKCYPRRSREELRQLIYSETISIARSQNSHFKAGKPKPSFRLLFKDEIHILNDKKKEPPVSFDYQILYEDNALFVIHKPPFLPVHPAGRYFFNTLLTHLKTKNPLEAKENFFLVHRIDRETSGVLVLTKTKQACAHLSHQFANRIPEKRYLAIVYGNSPETFKADFALKRSTQSKIQLKMMATTLKEGGQEALTLFKKKKTRGAYSLIECFPKTGRQHQIRVHLEALGYPIVGDKLYGVSESEALPFYDQKNFPYPSKGKLILPRHALHASWIRLTHPITEKKIEFSSPLPPDLTDFFLSAGPSQ